MNYEYTINNCISLVIPATFFSWNRCRRQIEIMICKSKDIPKETIIVVSDSKIDKHIIYRANCSYSISVYYRRGKKNSASNKNYGFKRSICKYISFFDSDDIMFDTRITVLNFILQNFAKIDIIMHMFSLNITKKISYKLTKKEITNFFYLNSSYITYLYRKYATYKNVMYWGCCNFLPKHLDIANGWITAKRELLMKEHFNEDYSVRRAEDSEYNGRVILKGYNALILKMVLGYYSKRNICNYYGNSIIHFQ